MREHKTFAVLEINSLLDLSVPVISQPKRSIGLTCMHVVWQCDEEELVILNYNVLLLKTSRGTKSCLCTVLSSYCVSWYLSEE